VAPFRPIARVASVVQVIEVVFLAREQGLGTKVIELEVAIPTCPYFMKEAVRALLPEIGADIRAISLVAAGYHRRRCGATEIGHGALPHTFALPGYVAHMIDNRLVQRTIQLIELIVEPIQLLRLCRGEADRILAVDQVVVALYESDPPRFFRRSATGHPAPPSPSLTTPKTFLTTIFYQKR